MASSPSRSRMTAAWMNAEDMERDLFLFRFIAQTIQVKRCGPTQTRQVRRATRNPCKSGTSGNAGRLELLNFSRVARAAEPVSAGRARRGVQPGVRPARPQASAPRSLWPDAPAPDRSAPDAAA